MEQKSKLYQSKKRPKIFICVKSFLKNISSKEVYEKNNLPNIYSDIVE